MIIMFRKSNRLASAAQAVRVELVHKLLQKSIERAEEQMAQLRSIDNKVDSQIKKSNMILSTVKCGATHL
jgi:hypothetical protein